MEELHVYFQTEPLNNMKTYEIDINGKHYTVEVLGIDGQTGKVSVNGTPYTVQIKEPENEKNTSVLSTHNFENELSRPVSAKGAITSPLPGTILKIEVSMGQSVKRGDRLMVLEAMKMENDILSDRDGKVSAIQVSQGASVREGQTLIEIN